MNHDDIREQYPSIAKLTDYINSFENPRAALATFLALAEQAKMEEKQ